MCTHAKPDNNTATTDFSKTFFKCLEPMLDERSLIGDMSPLPQVLYVNWLTSSSTSFT